MPDSSRMPTDRSEQIERVFDEACRLPAADRAALLEARCGSDAALRAEVESLLIYDARSEHFPSLPRAVESLRAVLAPDRLPADVSATRHSTDGGLIDFARREAATVPRAGELSAPARCGPYRLVRPIASGGMGTVWLAERADQQFERTVAIKLIKRGMDTDDILERFRHERQVLAHLQHPNIAHLLDGGATEDGRPYLVMEYVDGLPIDRYCRELSLSIRERLELFCVVCAAVDAAHRHLVIHRDLKPANILVTPDGLPKLLDFGIAKVLNLEASAHTMDVTATAPPSGLTTSSKPAAASTMHRRICATGNGATSQGAWMRAFGLWRADRPSTVSTSTHRATRWPPCVAMARFNCGTHGRVSSWPFSRRVSVSART